MSREDQDQHWPTPPAQGDDASVRPVSNRRLALFLVALAAALVLGYLLLSKLADMSQEEDCALAHRRNCGASEVSSPTRLASVATIELAGR